MKKHIRKFISSQSKYQRDKKISLLKPFFHPEKMVLDVGVWSNFPEPNPSENWLEKKYSQDVQIVAVGLDDMRDFKKKYPNALCVQASGCALPFKKDAFASSFSNAVLEHVEVQGQLDFVQEISRVTMRRVVLAVPDRLSPIEIHSRIFLLHWLPYWRKIFAFIGEKYWASHENLSSIFTKKSLRIFWNLA